MNRDVDTHSEYGGSWRPGTTYTKLPSRKRLHNSDIVGTKLTYTYLVFLNLYFLVFLFLLVFSVFIVVHGADRWLRKIKKKIVKTTPSWINYQHTPLTCMGVTEVAKPLVVTGGGAYPIGYRKYTQTEHTAVKWVK